jgi:hypothetical protein
VTTAVVQFSTGVGSGEVAYRAVAKYGVDNVVLLTADTKVEDEDNWRYAREVHADLGRPEWVVLADGRTPMQVGRDARCVPSNRMPVCSINLKIQLLRTYIDERWGDHPSAIVVMLGFDWTEEHRLAAALPYWEPYTVECPLMDAPYLAKSQLLDLSRVRGIEPPRLYAAGFSHANCGGGCVRGGQAAWRRLLFWNPARYAEWEAEEETTRAMLDKDVAILRERSGPNKGKALSLRTYRERLQADALSFDADDEGACGCTEFVVPVEAP